MLNLTKTTNILAAISLLAAATAWASAPLVPIAENESLLIDDFEDGDYNSNLGVWESFTGEGYNATFERSIVDSEEKNSKVLRIDYEFQDEQENNGWEWMETRVLVANYTSLDFSNCTEIQFDYKADYQNNSAYDNWLDLRFRVEGDDKNAYVETDYHSIPLDASDDWQTVTVHWNDFFQDGWGINLPVETVQKNMLAFGWFWHTEHAAQGTIELDNFRCINQPKYEVTFMADGKVFASDMYYSGTTPRDPLEECKYYDHCTRPTKEPSETMMYTFKEWDKNIEPVTAPVVYTALFDSTVIPRGVPLNMVGDTLLLENFEDGNGVGLLGGTWGFFDAQQTEESGSTSSIETVSENKILGIGNLAKPEEPYEWLGARLYLLEDSSAVDMSQCEAIQYRYKGGSHQFRVESEYENGWQHYHKDLPSSDDWTTVNIDWNRLEGYEWVDEGNLPLKQVGVIKHKVVALTWQKDWFSIDADGNGPIEIDDIQCIRNLPKVLVEFYSEGNKVGETSVPYATYFKNVKTPNDPVKVSENGEKYVFVGWTPEMYYDFELTKNLRLDALFVPTRKLEVAGQTLLLDDFEDGDMVGEQGNEWRITTKDGSATVGMTVAEDADGKWLKANLTNEEGSYMRADIVLNLQEDDVVLDLSQCDAIQYDYRTVATHQFHLGSVFDSLEIERDYFKTEWGGEENANWRTKTVYLENDSLECHSGCKPVSEVKKAVFQLSWSFEGYASHDTPVTFEIDNVKCLRTKFGAMTISAVDSTAIIDGLFTDGEVLDISEDIVVKNVELQRTFEVGKSSTVMLPFSIDVSKVNGADFYSLAEMEYADGEWKAGATKVTGTLEANTPYLAIPTASAITFDLEENETVTLNTTGSKVTKLGDWEFRGAYGAIAMADSTHLLGRAYGFAGEDKDGYKIGEFVKLGKGATIPALRTYLVKSDDGSSLSKVGHLQRVSANSGTAALGDLPDRITVEIMNEKKEVVGTGSIDIKSGVFRIDRWYDLRGRRLNGKPTAKGTYYNNGNMVIVK